MSIISVLKHDENVGVIRIKVDIDKGMLIRVSLTGGFLYVELFVYYITGSLIDKN